MQRFRDLTLKEKIKLSGAAMVIGLFFFMVMTVVMNNSTLNGFDRILDLNSKSYYLQQALSQEQAVFRRYMISRADEDREECQIAFVRSRRCIEAIPLDPAKLDRKVYMNLWTIWNVYDYYSDLRDEFFRMDEGDERYLSRLYDLYKIQDYFATYTGLLTESVLKWGNVAYVAEQKAVRRQQAVLAFACISFFVLIVKASRSISQKYVTPLVRMAEDAKRISNNDFSGEGFTSSSRDEMGILVKEFQRMKNFTKGYMEALKKENEMEALLHQKELSQMELEKESEAMRLQVLQNQVNPHFLFNTLNIIACNARVEHEQTTGRLIRALSNLFRYNLRTTSVSVPLEQELDVLEQYLYIQKTRFGDRIRCRIQCPDELKKCEVPSFILQPLVENSIVHGLMVRPEGGQIHVRAARFHDRIMIVVADNGVGIPRKKQKEIYRRFRTGAGRTSEGGIGIGNVARRVRLLFPNGKCRILSKVGIGTRVIISFTEERKEDAYGTEEKNPAG